ncbi:MAG: S-methyl-5-thioribose-1-phosphate isomerase [Lentisphaerae bacterium]|nr:S-methyl-5-thioribose-1-phosphate isomerase [Lentisphaerota bacterium]
MPVPRTVEWVPDVPGRLAPGHVRMIDQTRLPAELAFIDTADVRAIWAAIRSLQVRGAPAIGIAAAMGVAAAAQAAADDDPAAVVAAANRAAEYLAGARPTAVNLFWALDRMKSLAARSRGLSAPALKETLAREAMAVRDEDAAMCRRIGELGAALLRDGDTVLTHCNAGGLATAEFGTALAPIYVAAGQGKKIRVFADETRPLLQGARLTSWELMQAGIDVTLICDGAAAQVMKEGRVNAVLVGADRIAANGDAANKIGTYGVALLAGAHGIPFYVLAPTSTMDPRTPDGSGIVIEERGAEEVTCGFGRRTAPEGVRVYAPAFDVTPHALIAAIVCEKGVLRPDYGRAIAEVTRKSAAPAACR